MSNKKWNLAYPLEIVRPLSDSFLFFYYIFYQNHCVFYHFVL